MQLESTGWVENYFCKTPIARVSQEMDRLEKHNMQGASLSHPASDTSAAISIAHDNNALVIKLYINEPVVRSVNSSYCGNVWSNSFVEIFMGFNEESLYYNLEVDCFGAVLMGYGKGLLDRYYLSSEVTNGIGVMAEINYAENNYAWELLIVLPVLVFADSKITQWTNASLKAGFYKQINKHPNGAYLSRNSMAVEKIGDMGMQHLGKIVFSQA